MNERENFFQKTKKKIKEIIQREKTQRIIFGQEFSPFKKSVGTYQEDGKLIKRSFELEGDGFWGRGEARLIFEKETKNDIHLPFGRPNREPLGLTVLLARESPDMTQPVLELRFQRDGTRSDGAFISEGIVNQKGAIIYSQFTKDSKKGLIHLPLSKDIAKAIKLRFIKK